MITSEARYKYVHSGGLACPYCGSENISAGDTDTDIDGKRQYVECLVCHKTWTDIYKLVDMQGDEE